MSRPILTNADARRLFLHRHRLLAAPSGPGKGGDLAGLIRDLGFVQFDSVRTLARAHDLILYSRRPAYRPKALRRLIDKDRALFEHWTHDASIIPMAFYPHWRLKFAREAETIAKRWTKGRRAGFLDETGTVLEQIAKRGAISSSDVGEGEARSSDWWDWHPSKTALEYLWMSGQVAICHRRGIRKFYDLPERVIPADILARRPSVDETVNWALNGALDRLGFATSGELAAFWAIVTPQESAAWVAAQVATGALQEIDVEMSDGRLRKSVAWPDWEAALAGLPDASQRVRVLSPFDPALRDRARAERLFGFFYRIEIFVPAPKRQYGYYIFPVLEGTTLIGRMDAVSDGTGGPLEVRAFWPEARVRMGTGRIRRLTSELERVARFAGASDVAFAEGWLRG